MQSLYGLQQLGLTFELKGGTSLSKGYGLISRFSEDIDIRIEPPADPPVMTGRNHDKAAHVQSRKDFYNRLGRPSLSTASPRSSATRHLMTLANIAAPAFA